MDDATALEPLTARSATDGLVTPDVPAVATLAPVAVAGRLVLRAAPALAREIGAGLGQLAFDGPVNREAAAQGVSALRLGPDEWLLLAEGDADPWLAARIGSIGGEVGRSVVDVTHRQAGFALEGPAVEDVLATGCPLPLDIQRFPVGRATRTLFEKAEVVLWRRGAERFHIEVSRSFAPYLVGFLSDVIHSEAAILNARR